MRAAFLASLPPALLPGLPEGDVGRNPPAQSRTAEASKNVKSPFPYLHIEGSIGKTHLAVRGVDRLLEPGSALYVNEEDHVNAVGDIPTEEEAGF